MTVARPAWLIQPTKESYTEMTVRTLQHLDDKLLGKLLDLGLFKPSGKYSPYPIVSMTPDIAEFMLTYPHMKPHGEALQGSLANLGVADSLDAVGGQIRSCVTVSSTKERTINPPGIWYFPPGKETDHEKAGVVRVDYSCYEQLSKGYALHIRRFEEREVSNPELMIYNNRLCTNSSGLHVEELNRFSVGFPDVPGEELGLPEGLYKRNLTLGIGQAGVESVDGGWVGLEYNGSPEWRSNYVASHPGDYERIEEITRHFAELSQLDPDSLIDAFRNMTSSKALGMILAMDRPLEPGLLISQ